MRKLLTPFEYLFYLFGIICALLIVVVVIILYPITLGYSAKWIQKLLVYEKPPFC